MERSTPVRKSHASTADLLVWEENQPAGAGGPGSQPNVKSHQPSDGVSRVLFGGQMTEEEAQSLLKRKICSGSKLKEMTGSGIFAAEPGDTIIPNGSHGLRLCQQAANAISQISFSTDESVIPEKPVSLAEVAKQRELSGNLDSESEPKINKQLSEAKCKEICGHNIFGPPPEVPVKLLGTQNSEKKDDLNVANSSGGNLRFSEDVVVKTARKIHEQKYADLSGNDIFKEGPSNLTISEEAVLKTARKVHDQKHADLSGNDIFKGDTPPGSAEKTLSIAKLREMSGSDIFADGGKVASRDYLGGVRKPPGGESSIALI